MSVKKVYWSDEDQCFIGWLANCGDCCHGNTEDEVWKQLKVIDEEWEEINLVDRAKIMREKMGKSQSDFARLLGVPARTYIKWERGERNPGGAALSLLKLVIHSPEQSFKVLAGA